MWVYLGGLLVLLLVWWFRPRRISFRDVRPVLRLGSHQWVSLESDSFCAGCFRHIGGWLQLNGVQCQVCHMSAHVMCSRTKMPTCKPVTSNAYKDTNPHHWVRAELQLNATCCQCRTLCGSAYVGADAVICSWCQRTAHISCSSRFDEECDFGRLKKVIIPPSFVKLESTEILELPLRVAPIVVVVNSKSGGQLGLLTLSALYGLLNPVQVLDLVGEGINRLNWYRSTKRLMLLVAGGDGTVSSVISALYDDPKPWSEPPPVAILPLGTGNDLSITLNWGKSASGCESLSKMTVMLQELLQEVSNARKSLLDRWTVTIGGKTTYTMCNYVGIGLDAKVAWDFQRLRDRKPYLFSSRTANKFIYGHLGSFDLFSRTCKDLQARFTLKVDGKVIDLPYLENLIIMNIPYFAGGAAIWGSEDCLDSQSSDDSLTSDRTFHYHLPSAMDRVFEVAGLSSILHLGECQIGLKECIRVSQGQDLTLTVSGNAPLPLQIDGEPQMVRCPVRVKVAFKDQVWMLSRNVEPEHELLTKVYKVITQAEAAEVITSQQREALMAEIARKVKK